MVEIISRAEWGARPPKNPPRVIPIPTKELWLHHSVSSSGFALRVRAIQNYHMDIQGWNDIAYSFVINHDGDIYMGRGPGVSGAHTAGHNTVSHAICLLGNFNTTQPTAAALDSLKALIKHGHGEGWWPVTLTGGHRDTRGSKPLDCPGDILYKLIPAINKAVLEEDEMTPEESKMLTEIHAAVAPSASWSATVGTGVNKQTLSSVLVEARNYAKLAAAAAAIADNTVNLSDADLDAIADAVADEKHRRLAD